jgi:rhodanese-related sulfurtransferase
MNCARDLAPSDIAAQRLVELGYVRVYHLAGGRVAWEAGGRSLVKL